MSNQESTQYVPKRELSSKELQYIQSLVEWAKPKESMSEFVDKKNWKDGEIKTFYFDASPEAIKIFEREDGKYGPQRGINFQVVDPSNNKPYTLSFSKTHAEKVLEQIKKGNMLLDIERIGEDKNTIYRVKASS